METPQLVREMYGGDMYEYYPLGKYVVAARGVCGGRPTLKYTRMDARHVIGWLQLGRTAEDLAIAHRVPIAAIHEVVKLQSVYDYEKSYA
ncbi:MAG: DUF433 domain-containing protein [Acidobacteriota bacterium]|nr:DUF433 domain-containing protein [Acidobacteriota bacterium]